LIQSVRSDGLEPTLTEKRKKITGGANREEEEWEVRRGEDMRSATEWYILSPLVNKIHSHLRSTHEWKRDGWTDLRGEQKMVEQFICFIVTIERILMLARWRSSLIQKKWHWITSPLNPLVLALPLAAVLLIASPILFVELINQRSKLLFVERRGRACAWCWGGSWGHPISVDNEDLHLYLLRKLWFLMLH
jgi:hypothetical protein